MSDTTSQLLLNWSRGVAGNSFKVNQINFRVLNGFSIIQF